MKEDPHPCKQCLVLGACKSKHKVHCELLERHFMHLLHLSAGTRTYKHAFDKLKIYLPELRKIRGNGHVFTEPVKDTNERRRNEQDKM